MYNISVSGTIFMKTATYFLLNFFLFITSLHCSAEKPKEHTKDIQPIVQEEKSQEIIITAVGDIMMGTNYPNESSMPPRDAYLLKPVTDALKQGDIIFGNLEGPVLDSGGNPKSCNDPATCYVFRQPEYFVKELKDAGFNMLSIANNHVGDLGEPGRINTIKVLEQHDIRYAGQTSCPWDTLRVKGLLVGMTAFAPNKGCLDINDENEIKKVVKKLDGFCDIVIVSFHGGAEGQSHTHVPRKHELFLGQDRGDVHAFARQAIDAGADIVLGHGPHITRAIDLYKGRFIAYSMGNFCTYEKFNIKGISGMAPIFELRLTNKGEFLSGKVTPTRQFGRGGPIIDDDNSVIEEIKRLTKEDIPEVELQFTERAFTIQTKK
jgi:poly-gamma-glutamate capsule biosynthesis protein CapA/YwtB (metallophosphatase superfamily)